MPLEFNPLRNEELLNPGQTGVSFRASMKMCLIANPHARNVVPGPGWRKRRAF